MIPQDLESGIDALAELFLGPDFARALETEHELQAVKIPFRALEFVYIDEVETPDGYPALELVAGDQDVLDEAGDSDQFEHEISFQFTVNGTDLQTMSRELKRLIRATRRMMKQGNFSPVLGGRFRTSQAQFGRSSPGRTEDYVQSAAMRVFWVTSGI